MAYVKVGKEHFVTQAKVGRIAIFPDFRAFNSNSRP
jgi:hypothetical protein